MVADPQAPAQLTDAQQGPLPGNLHENTAQSLGSNLTKLYALA